jgi:hypothetical protein
MHIYINMFSKVGLLEETNREGKEEKNDREWIALKYTMSGLEQDTAKCIEIWWTI